MIYSKRNTFLFLSLSIWSAAVAHPTLSDSLVVHSNVGKGGSSKEGESLTGNFNNVPRITELRVFSNVRNRFANTVVRSRVKNYANVSKETTFSLVLPESAFISGFVMEIAGKNYTAYVKEKEEAKRVYDQAVASGFGAAHVAVDTRDSNVFTVSVNLEPESKAVFYLTYEELLVRQNGHYEFIINIRPGQTIKDLGVEVNIAESRPIKDVKAPPLRSGNEIGTDKDELDPRAITHLINSTAAVITFAPNIQRQKELAKYLGTKEDEGLAGQFVVQYDVERDPHGGEVLLDDGYFVHFFAPSDLQPLAKHVVFVLDTSGSMYGQRITQLKEAMISILSELKSADKFSLVEFNSDVIVWDLQNKSNTARYPPGGASWGYQNSQAKLEDTKFPPAYSVTPEQIQKAKSTVTQFQPDGGTNIFDALRVALYLVEKEKNKGSEQLQPLIMFLTDGEPTVGITAPDEIISKVTEYNSGPRRSVIFTLSFGDYADKSFLQKLALRNSGFSKHIYEAADASLQLQDFYKTISSPLLSNVTFKYSPTVTGITKAVFPVLFGGSEIVVAGRYSTETADEVIARPVEGWTHGGCIDLRPVITRSVTNPERLWAYLTIKQLLEQKEVAKNPEELKKKALDLALEYSFVTPVSSLVVVKPNETRQVDPEARPTTGYPTQFLPLNAWQVPPLAIGGYSASSYMPMIKQVAPSAWSRYSFDADAAAFAPLSGHSMDKTFGGILSSRSDDILEESELSIAEPAPILDFPWLNNITNEQGIIKLPTGDFVLGFNETIAAVPGCSNTPNNSTGNCSLLKDCPLAQSFLQSIDDLIKYFCPLQRYVGVCCPTIDMP